MIEMRRIEMDKCRWEILRKLVVESRSGKKETELHMLNDILRAIDKAEKFFG